MRIAHLSDLHLLDLEGAVPFRLFNKRLTGYMNLRFRRGHKHKPEPVRAAARALRALSIDHVVVTGDVSNLAREREFERVREFLEGDVGLTPDHISVVPGNHDVYTTGSVRAARFRSWFQAYLQSDLPEVTGKHGFPYVRLRGPVAFIGLSTAVARPPFVASGHLGHKQIEALASLLEHPEVKKRTPVILQHHPIHNPDSRVKTLLEGLVDARAEVKALAPVSRGLLLHGHLHRRLKRTLTTPSGVIQAIGATSASMLHHDDDRMAGFNLYEVADNGDVVAVGAQRFEPTSGNFVDTRVPAA